LNCYNNYRNVCINYLKKTERVIDVGCSRSLRIKWMCQRFKAFIRESIDGIICKTRLLKSYLINMTGFYVTIRWAPLERCSPGSGFRLIRHIRVPSHLLGEWHLKISKLTNGAYYNNTWWFKGQPSNWKIRRDWLGFSP